MQFPLLVWNYNPSSIWIYWAILFDRQIKEICTISHWSCLSLFCTSLNEDMLHQLPVWSRRILKTDQLIRDFSGILTILNWLHIETNIILQSKRVHQELESHMIDRTCLICSRTKKKIKKKRICLKFKKNSFTVQKEYNRSLIWLIGPA